MHKIVFAGSFDPFTNGHLWVIEEALTISTTVIVLIAANPNKKYMFTPTDRKQMIEAVCAKYGNRVQVIISNHEYVSQQALRLGANHLIRGIRSASDFDYESNLQQTNVDVLGGAKTLFVIPPSHLERVSSSYIKSLIGPIGWHNYIHSFVPNIVYKKIIKNYISTIARKHITNPNVEQLLSILDMYDKEDRYYHNLNHIVHVIQELEWLYNNHDIEIDYQQYCAALIGHDIIHGTANDEESSANYIAAVLSHAPTFRDVSSLIKATDHKTKEYPIMRSIDLTILGQPARIYDKYSKQIRQEYSKYSESEYIDGRISVLNKILDNDTIYCEQFSHYESQARKNIQNELDWLML